MCGIFSHIINLVVVVVVVVVAVVVKLFNL
jgi:hypothetical protein